MCMQALNITFFKKYSTTDVEIVKVFVFTELDCIDIPMGVWQTE